MPFEMIDAIFKNQRLDLIKIFSVSEIQTVLNFLLLKMNKWTDK